MRAGSRRLAAALVLAATVAGGASIPAAHGEDPTGEAAGLQRENAALESQARSVELELYAIQSRLDRTRGELAALERRSAALARERQIVRKQVGMARQTLAASQEFLAMRLRALYEQGDAHPLEILLGARSLDEAVSGLDGLTFAAQQDREIMAQARSADRRLRRLARRLSARSASLAELRGAVSARAVELAGARAAREGFLAELVAEQGLNAVRIAALEHTVAAARARTQGLALAPAASPAARPASAPAGAAPPSAPGASEESGSVEAGRRMTVIATGYALPGITASGIPVGWGVAAVDPSVIPMGTRFTVPGYGVAVAADTGSAVRGAKIDLWFPSVAQALRWGVRTVTITIHG